MPEKYFTEIEARLAAVGSEGWEAVVMEPSGDTAIRLMGVDGLWRLMRVTRDSSPVSRADLEFISHGPEDLRLLIAYLRGDRHYSVEELKAISARAENASRSPWRAFLKGEGGIGGDSVIWIGEDDREPDLYLWTGSAPASDVYFELVAAMRQDIPQLINEANDILM